MSSASEQATPQTSEPTVAAVPRPATGEIRVLAGIQAAVGRPPVISVARGMSHFGEHALGWMAISALGAVVDRRRRDEWIGVGVGAVGAHAASIAVKRVVRRRRPDHPAVAVNVSTPSRLSFPSSHATSTAAATLLIGRLVGRPVPATVVPAMMASRLVLGVHYPTDVLAGATLGALSAAAVTRGQRRWLPRRAGTSRSGAAPTVSGAEGDK